MVIDVESAYASCVHDARTHYENFPVASWLVPRPLRRHVAALYAFARAADDFADEGTRSSADRLSLLDGWRSRLRAAEAASTPGPAPGPGEPPNTQAIFVALGDTIRSKRLPLALFEDLLSAFSQDVTVARYATWDDLLDYCRRSSNPVGRLVLRIAGHDDPRFDCWSDAICSALQLTNFWQDLAIDFDRGRIYLPAEELRRHGADERSFGGQALSPAWRAALAEAVVRTRVLFDAGRPLCTAMAGRLKYELRATWLGGTRVLSRIQRADYDVVDRRPRLRAADLPWLAWHLLTWSGPREAGARDVAAEPR